MLLKIAMLPGDGIGPEVLAEGVRVIEAVARVFGHALELKEALIGGSAIDATGIPLPPATLEVCVASDAVLLGAVGGTKWDDPRSTVRPEQGLLGLRKALGLFGNLRPIRGIACLNSMSPVRQSRENPTDFIFVRELTGGIYFGEKKHEVTADGETASDLCAYSSLEIERIVRMAARLARERKRRLISVDKANVLETSRLWRRTAERIIATEFPDVQLEHMLVDACAMFLLQNPARFDVIVTENMFGDILTDEASVLAGSMGLLPSASLGSTRNAHGLPLGLYEPIHGSAPDIAGKGIANPVGMLLSVAMLLRHSFGLETEAAGVERAVEATLAAGLATPDIATKGNAVPTRQLGQDVVERILAQR